MLYYNTLNHGYYGLRLDTDDFCTFKPLGGYSCSYYRAINAHTLVHFSINQLFISPQGSYLHSGVLDAN